jgi:hypothetical protein
MENGENKLIQLERVAWKLGYVFFRDEVEEIVRNASCFIISFPIHD